MQRKTCAIVSGSQQMAPCILDENSLVRGKSLTSPRNRRKKSCLDANNFYLYRLECQTIAGQGTAVILLCWVVLKHPFIHPSIHPSIHSFIHSCIHTAKTSENSPVNVRCQLLTWKYSIIQNCIMLYNNIFHIVFEAASHADNHQNQNMFKTRNDKALGHTKSWMCDWKTYTNPNVVNTQCEELCKTKLHLSQWKFRVVMTFF